MSAPGIAINDGTMRERRSLDFEQRLAPREWIIARALVHGQSLPAIAAMLHVSIEGLTSEMASIFRSLGVATLAHMLLLAELPELASADIVYVEDLGSAIVAGAVRQFG